MNPWISLAAVLAAAALLWTGTLTRLAAAALARAGRADEHRRGLRLALVAAAAAYLFYALGAYRTGLYMTGDGPNYLLIARSLEVDGDLDLHGQIPNPYSTHWNQDGTLTDFHSYVSAGQHGEWYPKHPWLYPLLMVPVDRALGPPGWLLAQFGFGLLLAAAMYRLASRFASPPAALVATVLLVYGSPLGHPPVPLGVDLPAALAVAASAAVGPAAARGSGGDRDASGARRSRLSTADGSWALAGALAGIAVLLTVRNAIFVPFIAAYALCCGGRRAGAAFALGGLPFLALFGATNRLMFGSPFTTAYDRIMVLQAGVPGLSSHRRQFALHTAAVEAVRAARQMLAESPAAILALAGWRAMMRTAQPAAQCLTLAVIASATLTVLFRGAEPARFLMPAISLLVVPLACFADVRTSRPTADPPPS